jgi:hypothetical protein
MDKVFMASAIDEGSDPGFIEDPKLRKYYYSHSMHKEAIGQRLALGAFDLAYQIPTDYAAPRVLDVRHREPNNIEIDFVSGTGRPFEIKVMRDGGFEVCCDSDTCDQFNYQSVNWMLLSGMKKTTRSQYLTTMAFKKPLGCKTPVFVRYLWRSVACELHNCPLYSANSNLPITPFIYKINDNATSHKLRAALNQTFNAALGSTSAMAPYEQLTATSTVAITSTRELSDRTHDINQSSQPSTFNHKDRTNAMVFSKLQTTVYSETKPTSTGTDKPLASTATSTIAETPSALADTAKLAPSQADASPKQTYAHPISLLVFLGVLVFLSKRKFKNCFPLISK